MKTISNTLKRIATSISLGILGALLSVGTAFAAEINPNPSTYSFGSTSEFSPFLTLGQSTPTPGTLTPTGQNQIILVGIAIGLIALACLTLFFVSRHARLRRS